MRASPALLCAALALSGCGDDPGGAPLLPGAAASVTLSTSAAGALAAGFAVDRDGGLTRIDAAAGLPASAVGLAAR